MKWLAIVLLLFSLLPGPAPAQEAKRRVAFLAFSPFPAYEASFNKPFAAWGGRKAATW